MASSDGARTCGCRMDAGDAVSIGAQPLREAMEFVNNRHGGLRRVSRRRWLPTPSAALHESIRLAVDAEPGAAPRNFSPSSS